MFLHCSHDFTEPGPWVYHRLYRTKQESGPRVCHRMSSTMSDRATMGPDKSGPRVCHRLCQAKRQRGSRVCHRLCRTNTRGMSTTMSDQYMVGQRESGPRVCRRLCRTVQKWAHTTMSLGYVIDYVGPSRKGRPSVCHRLCRTNPRLTSWGMSSPKPDQTTMGPYIKVDLGYVIDYVGPSRKSGPRVCHRLFRTSHR